MKLDFNLKGRVRNLNLPPSTVNSLIPIFEAVTNSIQAIESRYNSDLSKGNIYITIELDREKGTLRAVVMDNGVGLNKANFESFRTSDSEQKSLVGGKGVGRLSWLKTFDHAQVNSTYENETGEIEEVSFEFRLDTEEPISQLATKKLSGPNHKAEIGTAVILSDMSRAYFHFFPKKANTAAQHLVRHFLPYIASPSPPKFTLIFEREQLQLHEIYDSAKKEEQQGKFTISSEAFTSFSDFDLAELFGADITSSETTKDGEETQDSPESKQVIDFKLHHMLFDKSMGGGASGSNWLFFIANKRVVDGYPIDKQIGLRSFGDDNDTIYIGLISGDFLDERVSQERTSLAWSNEEAEVIKREALNMAKEYLAPYIRKVRDSQKELVCKLIDENPQFLSVKSTLDDFVNTKLALNVQDAETIYIELSRHKRRQRKQREKVLQKINSEENDEQLRVLIGEYTKEVNDDARGLLADYVVKRRSIIDLLS
ncbi:MAG: ATP-binding protein, partial [Rhodospirillaceae bacterium]|nr:ATP-binding protein [Rhodospirillaceae bacterium]